MEDGVRYCTMEWSNIGKWSEAQDGVGRSHCKEEQGSVRARREAVPAQGGRQRHCKEGSSVIARRSGREPVKGGVEQC